MKKTLVMGLCLIVPAWVAAETPAPEAMWEIIQEQQRTIESLKEKLDTTERQVEQTGVRVEATADRIEEVSTARSAATDWTDRVRIGGYGSIRGEVNDLDNEDSTFTFRRFVLTADAHVTNRLQAYLELEFERFAELELEKEFGAEPGEFTAEQVVEGTSGSELAIEQAWARYRIHDSLNVEMGSLLVPLGRFNINHDDNQWNLTRRSLVDKGVPVLPAGAAWPELGVGVTGDVPLPGGGLFDYRLYVMNGAQLDLEFEQEAESKLRDDGSTFTENIFKAEFEPTQGSASRDLNNNKVITGRFAYRPSPAHEVAVSGYYGDYTPNFIDDEKVLSVALDGLHRFGNTEFEYQIVHTDWGDVDDVIADFSRTVPRLEGEGFTTNNQVESKTEFEISGLSESRTGYWLELRHTIRPQWLGGSFLGRDFGNPQIEPTLRLEQVLFDPLDGGSDATLSRATLGVGYRPVDEWVFSVAGEYTWTNEDSLDGLTNFISAGPDEDDAFAFTFGVAYGF